MLVAAIVYTLLSIIFVLTEKSGKGEVRREKTTWTQWIKRLEKG